MEEKILKLLYDIDAAIKELDSYFTEFPKDFEQYRQNTILKRAIERDLEIIGEAIKRILKFDENFPIENAKRIISLRNQIIHAYDNISDNIIWSILLKHIPKLRSEVAELIKNR